MIKSKDYYKAKGERIIKYGNILMERLRDRGQIEEEGILKSLDQAQRELRDKERYFHSVTDEDLIDYAIYDLKASRMKYNYLLKKVKESDTLDR